MEAAIGWMGGHHTLNGIQHFWSIYIFKLEWKQNSLYIIHHHEQYIIQIELHFIGSILNPKS